jgi:hypothetical protein
LFSQTEGIVDQLTPPVMSLLDIDPWLIEPFWMFFDPSIYREHRALPLHENPYPVSGPITTLPRTSPARRPPGT